MRYNTDYMFRSNSFVINTEHSTVTSERHTRVVVAYIARFIMQVILAH